MNRKIILFVILLILAAYLNRSYSRIYDRTPLETSNAYWVNPIVFKNPSFQNTVKYVAIGDSLSVGVGTSDYTKTLPFTIAKKLSSGMSVSLVNVAVSGATIKDVINGQLDKAVIQKPNYITIFIGTNDLHHLLSVSEYKKDMNYILMFLTKNTSAKIIVFNLPYLGSENLILFPYNFIFNYQTRKYNDAISKICKDNNVTMIDLYTPTKQNFAKQPGFYSMDSFHPSGEGYIMWGSLVSQKEL